MTVLYNDPSDFVDEMIAGFVAAHKNLVAQVPGGVVRKYVAEEPTVGVVVGGGSGHYPAFAGLVGTGMAHGAAMGNVFASPSVQQIYSVAKSCEQGQGILLSYGNYAGDVLNFNAAQERLRSEGHDVRTVVVTDDIASAPAHEVEKRRGIAGDLTVFKIAGAAAEARMNLDEVERVAHLANERTRSLGVAFSGCTLPGAEHPLFSVPDGRMAVGLGIHGEPGLDEIDLLPATELASFLVTSLLDEVSGQQGFSSHRVVPLLNGLGAVKTEELFVLFGAIANVLERQGLTVVESEVGELCTSFDMAGCSLTLLWLDDELEGLWGAPANSPGFHKGILPASQAPLISPAFHSDMYVDASLEGNEATADSRTGARHLIEIFDRISATIDSEAAELGRIDSVAGDGDHGIGMQRGASAAKEAVHAAVTAGHGIGSVLSAAADAWGHRAGGTSGAMWAIILRSLGTELGNTEVPEPAVFAQAASSASDAVISAGKAHLGEKTMVDAIVPFVEEFTRQASAGASSATCWLEAAEAAVQAAAGTSALTASIGRARAHGNKSLGTPDPGAVSFAMICSAVAAVLNDLKEN